MKSSKFLIATIFNAIVLLGMSCEIQAAWQDYIPSFSNQTLLDYLTRRGREVVINLSNQTSFLTKIVAGGLAATALYYAYRKMYGGEKPRDLFGESEKRGMVTKEINIEGVTDIFIYGEGNLDIQQCSSCIETLEISVDKELLDSISFEIVNRSKIAGRKLIINSSAMNNSTMYQVTVKHLKNISVKGNVHVYGPITTDNLSIYASDSARVSSQLNIAQQLEVTLAGKAQVELYGNATEQKLTMYDFTKYDAAELISDNAYINMHGSSEPGLPRAFVNAKKTIKGVIIGESQLNCKINPHFITDIQQYDGAAIRWYK